MNLQLTWLPEAALRRMGTLLSFLVGVAILLQMTDQSFRPTLAQTRPFMLALTFLLAINAGWHGLHGYTTWREYRHKATWKASWRALGWQPFVAAGVILIGVLFFSKGESAWSNKAYAVPAVLGLVMGGHMAFAFAREDEPFFETTLTYPRPIAWLLLERVACALATYSLMALIGIGMTFALVDDLPLLPTLLGWISTLIFLGGLGVYITQSWRVAAFGAVIVVIVWFMFIQFGVHFLPDAPPQPKPLNYVQPFLWAVSPFLHPGDMADADYWLNRALVLLLGVHFILLGVHHLRDTEQLLLEGRSPSKSAT